MLFKYLSPERVDVLQNLKIRFTQPSELNDPFESALLVDAGNYIQIDVLLKETLENLNPQNDEERIVVAKFKAEMLEYAKQAMTPQNIGRGLIKILNQVQGVMSLSRSNDNLLLWSHYASSHKGYVLGLDESNEWFYGRDIRGLPTRPHNVIYTSRRSTFIHGSEEFRDRLLCYKSIEWAYEEEVRVFRSFGFTKEECDRHSPNQIHLFDLPPDCIKEIFIGANASVQMREQIFNAIRKNNLKIKVFQGIINDDRYEINYRPAFDNKDFRQKWHPTEDYTGIIRYLNSLKSSTTSLPGVRNVS